MRRRHPVNKNLSLTSTQASIRILRSSLVLSSMQVELQVEVRRCPSAERARSAKLLSQSPGRSGSVNTTVPTIHSYHLRKGFVRSAAHPQTVQHDG